MAALTKEEKIARLKNLYTLVEILEVMGYYEGIGMTGWNDDVQEKLESMDKDSQEFYDLVLENSYDNGNFEEAIKYNTHLPI
jgi:hypothetical protein